MKAKKKTQCNSIQYVALFILLLHKTTNFVVGDNIGMFALKE